MPAKQRLLVVSHGFPPYYGGAEHVAGHLAAAAAASGRWDVEVLTADIGGRLPPVEEWRGCHIRRVPTRKKKWAHHTVGELLSFLISARRVAGLSRPDWILAHFTLPGEWWRAIGRQVLAFPMRWCCTGRMCLAPSRAALAWCIQ